MDSGNKVLYFPNSKCFGYVCDLYSGDTSILNYIISRSLFSLSITAEKGNSRLLNQYLLLLQHWKITCSLCSHWQMLEGTGVTSLFIVCLVRLIVQKTWYKLFPCVKLRSKFHQLIYLINLDLDSHIIVFTI